MTPTVADTTGIPKKDWRRHSDPPSLWMAVAVGSASLHLLAFWLFRSYQSHLFWQPESQATIPIEVIEVEPQAKITPKPRVKPTTPKPVTTTQRPPQPTQPTPTDQQQSAIALAEQRQRELAEQRQRELAEQRQRELDAQRQRELDAQRQRELDAQRQRELDAQRQRELDAQRQRELDAQRQRELAEQRQRELAEQRQRELDAQRQSENQNNNNSNPLAPPSTSAGGSLLATIVGEPQQANNDRHTHPARIKASNRPISKGLEYVKFIEKKPGEPVELTVVLTISEQGKLENVMLADQAITEPEKSYYEDFVTNEVLKDWEFEPAYDNDPSDPKPSNLTVRIRIETLP